MPPQSVLFANSPLPAVLQLSRHLPARSWPNLEEILAAVARTPTLCDAPSPLQGTQKTRCWLQHCQM